ncbi:hypothetical protein DERP_012498 [Dermatophagoides pteronyssinus]|uniref:Uncharacterized protein n=1 Tax=Dermatophagoides pteronyssinus TaxID=6956 RepID=A0ABQ8IX52_DERPT|nr:hypothetical protein DERP_012498 [Dermatophagoides pteronyssinus]
MIEILLPNASSSSLLLLLGCRNPNLICAQFRNINSNNKCYGSAIQKCFLPWLINVKQGGKITWIVEKVSNKLISCDDDDFKLNLPVSRI